MNERLRAFVAGAVGMGLAFGLVELVHGIYGLVPSIPVSVSQRVIELTPGGVATAAIGALGKAATPILITVLVLSTLAIAGGLAILSLRSRGAALAGVLVLGAVALLAAFSEPFVAPIATVLTVVGALGAGTLVAGFLLGSSDLPATDEATGETPPEQPGREPSGGRSREAHSEGGVAVSRRNFVVLAGGAAVAGVAAAGAGRVLAGGGAVDVASGQPLPVRPGGTTGTGGEGPPFPPPGRVSVDVPDVPPWVTPTEDFYLIDTAVSPPRINRDRWTLRVRGAVDNPIEMSYDDLVSMPTHEAYITVACVSNTVGGGLVSNALWTGVMLSDVLREAGGAPDKIGPASEQLVGHSVDGWTSGFRTDLAFDGREAMVVYGMNGNELPPNHGYPVRLVVPGLYGYVSATKWLEEIELTDRGFDAYWIRRGWSKVGPIKTQARIDTVKADETLQAGTIPIGGVAWAPTRGISRVEVSTDGGETWNDARLAAQLDEDAWRQYVYEWDATPGEHIVQVRATDGNGDTQTEEEAAPIRRHRLPHGRGHGDVTAALLEDAPGEKQPKNARPRGDRRAPGRRAQEAAVRPRFVRRPGLRRRGAAATLIPKVPKSRPPGV